ncbi:hypothetical protein FAES_2756 [Fibrella aestuarina BUZ 2]|uniref:Uncharacterized protein n=1 Tax=Fibrella aestuarina BUZ 2 TaxID=1166018 RepID=I0K9G2_9BACT|nr:carbohydrate binding family 9 domain-containing protein [Fibrella aestuarina]CCH00765.1 hypothetical protein FAES_2756 [Fibrella aestuarina BUZ 2]
MIKPLLVLFLFTPFAAAAQDQPIFQPDSVKRVVVATPIQTQLRVDGRLDEAAWQQAVPANRFTMIEPVQRDRANHDTDIRLLFNQQYLYIGAFCRDSLGRRSIRATDLRRDFSFRSHDYIGISIDGFNDRRNAMMFMTNPYGTQRDLLSFDDLLYDTDWDGLWRVRTTRTDSGWVAEIAIPWQTLRYRGSQDSTQSWGINFFRNRRMTNEVSGWSRYPRSFSALRMDYAGRVAGLQPPPPRANIRVQPYVLVSSDRYNGTVVGNRRDEAVKLGGELKWAINPNTVLDLTANTDFAQADADRQVNNVTRFSVFFPERRQFFLENASLFGPNLSPYEDLSGGSMRIQPFFSRRIGLDNAGNPIPIDAGARLVHRSLTTNYGALLMRQRGVGNSPTTTFAVGRFSQNIGPQSRIGALLTLRDESQLVDSLGRVGQPGRTNWVGAIDGFFRLSESQSISTMLMRSGTSVGNVPTAGTSAAGDQGVAGYVQYLLQTNQWKFWWTESIVTASFNPGVGFVSRNDVVATTPGVFWLSRGKWLPFRRVIRAFEPGFMPEFYHSITTGRLVERQLNINPFWLNLQSGGFFGLFLNPTYQFLAEGFDPLGVRIAPGEYSYTRYAAWMASDPSRRLSYTLNYELGGYYNGNLATTDLTVRYAPLPHISLTGRYIGNQFSEVGENRESPSVKLYSIEGRFALNPRLQLIGFYQYNTDLNRDAYNIRLSWEYQPLSFLYLVFNQRAYTSTVRQQEFRQQEQHLIGKLSYLKQF